MVMIDSVDDLQAFNLQRPDLKCPTVRRRLHGRAGHQSGGAGSAP